MTKNRLVVGDMSWADMIPDWLLEEIKHERIIYGLAGISNPEAPKIGDAEVIAYLMTATSAQNLTSSIVASKLTSFSFTNVGITGTPGCVRIQMLISRNNPGGRTEYQTDILIDNSVTLKSN